MALVDPPAEKCQHCRQKTFLLQEQTSNRKIAITACRECDGKLFLFARVDGDPPRNA